MISFESDYTTGAHPTVLKRLIETNLEPLSGYGTDPYCESARRKIREACECPDADVHFLVGGTQTNSTVIAALCWLGCSIKDKTPPVPRYKGSVWVIFVAIGVATGLNHVINLYLVGHMASVVFFPVVNGGNLILTMLLALILDKERPTGRQWLGMGIGVVALLLLSFLNTGTVFAGIVPNVFDFR